MEQIIPPRIHPLSDREIEHFKHLTDTSEGWEQTVQSSNVTVNTRSFPATNIRMLRADSLFTDISPATVYDYLQDSAYRSRQKSVTYNCRTLLYINARISVEYVCIACMFPLHDRDFVLQKTCISTTDDFIIIYHSVEDELFGLDQGRVRAHTFLTGYRLRSTPEGTFVTYLSHSDPKGYIPSFICNHVMKSSVPSMVSSMYTTSMGYLEWKESTEDPLYMPWRVVKYRDPDLYATHESLVKWGFSFTSPSRSSD